MRFLLVEFFWLIMVKKPKILSGHWLLSLSATRWQSCLFLNWFQLVPANMWAHTVGNTHTHTHPGCHLLQCSAQWPGVHRPPAWVRHSTHHHAHTWQARISVADVPYFLFNRWLLPAMNMSYYFYSKGRELPDCECLVSLPKSVMCYFTESIYITILMGRR